MQVLVKYVNKRKRQVQKSDWINLGHQSGSDQLGSTWIIEKN